MTFLMVRSSLRLLANKSAKLTDSRLLIWPGILSLMASQREFHVLFTLEMVTFPMLSAKLNLRQSSCERHDDHASILSSALNLDEPLPYSASIVFEQSYSEVDGDSASLAELCCLVSALSESPVNQQIAVTGAVDQLAEYKR